MQMIAYFVDGEPHLVCPAEEEILDDDGQYTGKYTNNLQSLIAELPKGTTYTLIDESEAGKWWADNQPPPTVEQQQAAFTAAIQARLDEFAQGRNYDNALACATYATSTNPRFAAEGQYMVEARDATWAKGYAILDAVLSGQRAMPTVAEVMAELPPLVWPDGGSAEAATASTGEGGA